MAEKNMQNFYSVMQWTNDRNRVSVHNNKYIVEPKKDSYEIGDTGSAVYPGYPGRWTFVILNVGSNEEYQKEWMRNYMKVAVAEKNKESRSTKSVKPTSVVEQHPKSVIEQAQRESARKYMKQQRKDSPSSPPQRSGSFCHPASARSPRRSGSTPPRSPQRSGSSTSAISPQRSSLFRQPASPRRSGSTPAISPQRSGTSAVSPQRSGSFRQPASPPVRFHLCLKPSPPPRSGSSTPAISPRRSGSSTSARSPQRSGSSTPARSPQRSRSSTPAISPRRSGSSTSAISPQRSSLFRQPASPRRSGSTPAISPQRSGTSAGSPQRSGSFRQPASPPPRSGSSTPAISPRRSGSSTSARSPQRSRSSTPAISPRRSGSSTSARSPQRSGSASPQADTQYMYISSASPKQSSQRKRTYFATSLPDMPRSTSSGEACSRSHLSASVGYTPKSKRFLQMDNDLAVRKSPRLNKKSVISSRLKNSQSHESLLTTRTAMQSVDLTSSDVEIRPLHSSIFSQDHCFQVSTAHGSKYIACRTPEEREKWIDSLKRTVHPQQENCRRSESSLKIWVVEAKNVPAKKRYFCEICLDKTLYARTSNKMKNEMLFWGEQFEFNNLPPVEYLVVNMYREADRKKKKDRNMLVGYTKIHVSDITNRQYIERWFSTSSGTVGKGGKESKTDLPLMRLKVRYQTVHILPIQLYQDLSQYLQENYAVLCEVLEPLVNIRDKEEIATTLINIMQKLNKASDFLSELVMAEVLRLDNQQLTFRGNSIATKAMEAHMKLVGEKYLNDTLGDFVRTIIETDDDCEVDPSRVAMPTMLPRQQMNLRMYCDMVWTKIITSPSFFPSELRDVFSSFRQRCEDNGKEDLSDNLISASIFLRFLCPAILSPSLFHLTHEFPDERPARNLTLIAKTIQTLANFSTFGVKEEYMTFMNDFVEEEWSNMKEFIQAISTADRNDNFTEFDGYIDLGKEMSVLHTLLTDTLTRATEKSLEKLGALPKHLSQISEDLKDPNVEKRKQNSRHSQHYDNLVNIQAHIDHTTSPTELLREMLRGESPVEIPSFSCRKQSSSSVSSLEAPSGKKVAKDLNTNDDYVTFASVNAPSNEVSNVSVNAHVNSQNLSSSWNQMVSAAEVVNGDYIDLISFIDDDIQNSSMEMEPNNNGSQMSISQVSTIASSGYQSFGYSQSSSPVDNHHDNTQDLPKSPNINAHSSPLSFANPMYRLNHRGISSHMKTSSPILQTSSNSSLSSSDDATTVRNCSPVKSDLSDKPDTASDPLRRLAPRLSSCSSTESVGDRDRHSGDRDRYTSDQNRQICDRSRTNENCEKLDKCLNNQEKRTENCNKNLVNHDKQVNDRRSGDHYRHIDNSDKQLSDCGRHTTDRDRHFGDHNRHTGDLDTHVHRHVQSNYKVCSSAMSDSSERAGKSDRDCQRHSQSNKSVCTSKSNPNIVTSTIVPRNCSLELKMPSPRLSHSAQNSPREYSYNGHYNTVGPSHPVRSQPELSHSTDFTYLTQRYSDQLRRTATDSLISQRSHASQRSCSPCSDAGSAGALSPSGLLSPDDSSQLYRRLSAQNAVHMGIRSVQRRIHEQDKTKQEYESEVDVLKQQLTEAQVRLQQAQSRLSEHEVGTQELVSAWQVRLEESEERMRKQQAEKDDQMKTIIQRLIHVEDELRQEQEQMQKVVCQKEKVIEAQERRIRSLDTANNKLVTALSQLKDHYSATTRNGLNNASAASLKTKLTTTEIGGFKTSSC